MALSVLTYNAGTGSDTAASGAGPAGAITGAAATNGAGNVVNLDGLPDLSGVAVNDILWVNVAGVNINLTRITAVNDGADTVTTEDLTVLGGGVSWAIGGKRKTLENNASKKDWEDGKAGWRFVFEAGTYSITEGIDPGVGDDTDGPTEFVSSDPGTVVPVFDITTNIRIFNLNTAGYSIIIDGLKGTRSAGAWGGSIFVRAVNAGTVVVRRCIGDGTGMANAVDVTANVAYLIEDNEFFGYDQGATLGAINVAGGTRGNGTIRRNSIVGDATANGHGIAMGNVSNLQSIDIDRNIIRNCDKGIDLSASMNVSLATAFITNNLIENCDGDGLDINGTVGADWACHIEGNIFANNGGYGVNASAAAAKRHVLGNRNNHYYNNTSGARNNLAAGDGDTSGDPLYTDGASATFDATPQVGSPLIDAGSFQRAA